MFNVQTGYQTLSQYLIEIREILQDLAEYRWIVAEIARVDPDKNGHYWFELVEKSNGEIVAQCGAVVWRSNIDTIQNFFIKTGISLQRGIKILFYGKAIFHEKYGFKISIIQIDPSYTLGEMELRKKEILERLKKEGLIEKNKMYEIPLIIQRIAVISSESAAGYEDFLKILKENKYGFKFHLRLYDTFVQGQEAVLSIVNSLKQCAAEYSSYDVVVIIRGGGSVVDLQCFEEYEIAKTIALMPLPVFTGIGHTRDKTVADHVAHSSFKTPSEVAKFILERAMDFESKIDNLMRSIAKKAEFLMNLEISRTNNASRNLKISVRGLMQRLNSQVNLSLSNISKIVFTRLNSERERLFRVRNLLHRNTNVSLKRETTRVSSIQNKSTLKLTQFLTTSKFNLEKLINSLGEKSKVLLNLKKIELKQAEDKLRLLSPENILKRGYSITYLNGKVLKNALDARLNDQIQIHLYKGKLLGKVLDREEIDEELKLF